MDTFRSDPWWFRRLCDAKRYRWFCWLWAIGSFVHITLPHFASAAWFPCWLLSFFGLVLVAWRGCWLGWALSFAGLLIPIPWLEDQLTQSVVMLLQAGAALAFFSFTPQSSGDRAHLAFARAIRCLTVAVYGFAAFHKLNWDFLDPSVSCASGGLQLLAEGWAITAPVPSELLQIAPYLFLLAELSVSILFVFRPLAGITLASAVHVPLTIIFAPAFAFTLMPAWLFFLRERELERIVFLVKAQWVKIVAIGGSCGAISTTLYLSVHGTTDYYWAAKKCLMWIIFIGAITTYIKSSPAQRATRGAWPDPKPHFRRAWLPLLLGIWVLNALTPYAGLQFHRSAAMLSNLRIDQGCWNHLFVPEEVRIFDPYVRINTVTVLRRSGEQQNVPAVHEPLWSLEGIWLQRQRWCTSSGSLRQGTSFVPPTISIQGEYRGQRFTTLDACNDWPLPTPFFSGLRLFQTNLSRQCPQECLH